MFDSLSIGFVSYASSTVLFLFVLVISFIGMKKLNSGKLFLLLVSVTLIWSAMLTLSQLGNSVAFEIIAIAELLRYFTWFYVLQQASGLYQDKPFRLTLYNPFTPAGVIIVFVFALLTLMFNELVSSFFRLDSPVMLEIGWMMSLSIMGLVLVEQLYRNTEAEYRSRINYLVISAGAIFCYDFFVFANAMLVQTINYEYWSARGFINVLTMPTLILAAVRNPELAPKLHISRKFVFHSTALTGAGIYLILMASAGYFIKTRSGDWGNLFQVTFLFAAFLLLAALLFSSTFKTRIKRYVSQNFSNKYDYREEWNRFSETLLSSNEQSSIHKRVLQAVAQIVDSQGASLWLREPGRYVCLAGWRNEIDDYTPVDENSQLIQLIIRKQALITLDEYFATLTDSRSEHIPFNPQNSWLFIPLFSNARLIGFIHLRHSVSAMTLDDEDTELLSTIAHHAALYIAQQQAATALQQAEKFKSINQMTAFLTHDLKTLLSQLFLLVENGRIHKDNPAFIDDMLQTLDHVSRKMQRLVNQLKNPAEKSTETPLSIIDILENILQDYKLGPIQPLFTKTRDTDVRINANMNEFSSALKHIIQNAVDSVDKNGEVKIELDSNNSERVEIRIIDNGKGMTQEFIANRLFQPFESTKGVSGMGIGVYQSREYIRSLNGDIRVSSTPGLGTIFTITLPINTTDNE